MNSTVPSVLTAVAGVASTALPDLQLGQGTLLDTEDSFLIVGYDDGDNPAVSGARSTSGSRAGNKRAEVYDVSCLLSVWIGDADDAAVPAARVSLFGLLDIFDAALDAADKPTGVLEWYVADFSLMQPVTGEGATASLRFTVHVNAWRVP